MDMDYERLIKMSNTLTFIVISLVLLAFAYHAIRYFNHVVEEAKPYKVIEGKHTLRDINKDKDYHAPINP